MTGYIPESLLGKTEKQRRRKRRKRKGDLLVERRLAGGWGAAHEEEVEGGQRSWLGAARSQRPSVSEPRPPGGRGEEEVEDKNRWTERHPRGSASPQAEPAPSNFTRSGPPIWPLLSPCALCFLTSRSQAEHSGMSVGWVCWGRNHAQGAQQGKNRKFYDAIGDGGELSTALHKPFWQCL